LSFVKFLGIGSAAPEKILSNLDLEKMIDTSDEWILSRTGIAERRIVEPEVATSDLAYEASIKALEDASMDPEDIDGIVVGTIRLTISSLPQLAYFKAYSGQIMPLLLMCLRVVPDLYMRYTWQKD
jgi:3-oxoacyl-[acyl-carrier-protein] synthase III